MGRGVAARCKPLLDLPRYVVGGSAAFGVLLKGFLLLDASPCWELRGPALPGPGLLPLLQCPAELCS